MLAVPQPSLLPSSLLSPLPCSTPVLSSFSLLLPSIPLLFPPLLLSSSIAETEWSKVERVYIHNGRTGRATTLRDRVPLLDCGVHKPGDRETVGSVVHQPVRPECNLSPKRTEFAAAM